MTIYTRCEDIPHHARHIGLVLCAISSQEVVDDAKASRADFRIIALLIPVQVQQSDHQNQSLYSDQEKQNNLNHHVHTAR